MGRRSHQGHSNDSIANIHAARIRRWIIVLSLPFFLGACTALKTSIKEKIKEIKIVKRAKMRPVGEVVLKGLPRHLMVVPRKEFVWLWNKPGGMEARAIRLIKVPSRSTGRVLEYEPEISSHAIWGEEGLENYRRQPIRWVKVATFSGTGWVRTEFIDPR